MGVAFDSSAPQPCLKVCVKKSRTFRITRDGFLLALGVFLTINELVIRSGPERPYVLVLLGGMMGLPAFIRADEKRRNGGGK